MRAAATGPGFALLETLVALLLFAMGLLAACATLGASLRATHQALLASRAVDFAADHVEDLHAAAGADPDELLAATRERMAGDLPASVRDTALQLMHVGGLFRTTERP